MAGPRGVRVITGSARGRRLAVPPGDAVRPTTDRVKEAVFSALDARDALAGARVLDLCAGSGSLAIEALSRGAAHATLVERDPAALASIRANLATCGFVDRASVVPRDVAIHLRGTPPPEGFDVAFVDPPYDLAPAARQALVEALRGEWLAPGALVVVEGPRRGPEPEAPGYEVVWSRTFGETRVVLLAA